MEELANPTTGICCSVNCSSHGGAINQVAHFPGGCLNRSHAHADVPCSIMLNKNRVRVISGRYVKCVRRSMYEQILFAVLRIGRNIQRSVLSGGVVYDNRMSAGRVVGGKPIGINKSTGRVVYKRAQAGYHAVQAVYRNVLLETSNINTDTPSVDRYRRGFPESVKPYFKRLAANVAILVNRSTDSQAALYIAITPLELHVGGIKRRAIRRRTRCAARCRLRSGDTQVVGANIKPANRSACSLNRARACYTERCARAGGRCALHAV